MAFELNDERALDVMIWWVGGSDGSIEYQEEEKVKEVLKDMQYSMETYYQETIMHIGGLSTDKIKDLVEQAIQYASTNYSDHGKQKVIALLYAVAKSNENISEGEQDKIDRIRKEFGVEEPDHVREEE